MKAIFLTAFLAALTVFSQTEIALATPPGWDVRGHSFTTLPPETNELKMISGQLESVVEVTSRCPARAPRCRTSKYAVARLRFLVHCVNDAVVVGSSLKELPDGSFQLNVSAIELSNPRTMTVRCARPNVVTVDVPVPTSKEMTLENLEVVFSTRLYLPN